MVKWNEAFHIYVAMVAEETPNEIGNLTLYAQTIQRIANSCGDHTARLFVGNFGVEGNCPWHLQNVELYQESAVLGLDFKLKRKITMEHVQKAMLTPPHVCQLYFDTTNCCSQAQT